MQTNGFGLSGNEVWTVDGAGVTHSRPPDDLGPDEKMSEK